MAIPAPILIFPNPPTMDSTHSPITSSPIPLTQTELKRIAAYKAVDEFVESGTVIGLGTGSTAAFAVARIAELLNQGKLKNIIGIPTSKKTQKQALDLGIPLSDVDSHPILDLAIDGADEVDPCLNLVKGRGGSLLREKMIEGCCRRFVVIVDESKIVENLGGSGLAMPVEIVPFCWRFTAMRLEKLMKKYGGRVGKIRVCGDGGERFVSDNGNYIVDLYFGKEGITGDLKCVSDEIMRVCGVVEHGMFLGMATSVVVAGEGGVTVKNKED